MSEGALNRAIFGAACFVAGRQPQLVWKNTSLSCWLGSQGSRCVVGRHVIDALKGLIDKAQSIEQADVRKAWIERATAVVSRPTEAVTIERLTWLLLVLESPSREGTSEGTWNLYHWNVLLPELPGRVAQMLQQTLSLSETTPRLDLDTVAEAIARAMQQGPSWPQAIAAPVSWETEIHRTHALLKRFGNLIVDGVAASGKTQLSVDLAHHWEELSQRPIGGVSVVDLHPSVSGADLIEDEGQSTAREFSPKIPILGTGDTKVKFWFEANNAFHSGPLLEIATKAAADPARDYLLIFEDVHQVAIDRVLGEVYSALSFDARIPWSESDSAWKLNTHFTLGVTLPRSRRRFFLPANVYILALGSAELRPDMELDVNLSRRFVVHGLRPLDAASLRAAIHIQHNQVERLLLSQVVDPQVQLFGEINTLLEQSLGPRALIGHGPLFQLADSVLSAQDPGEASSAVLLMWRYRLLPAITQRIISFKAQALLLERNESTENTGNRGALTKLLDRYALPFRLVLLNPRDSSPTIIKR